MSTSSVYDLSRRKPSPSDAESGSVTPPPSDTDNALKGKVNELDPPTEQKTTSLSRLLLKNMVLLSALANTDNTGKNLPNPKALNASLSKLPIFNPISRDIQTDNLEQIFRKSKPDYTATEVTDAGAGAGAGAAGAAAADAGKKGNTGQTASSLSDTPPPPPPPPSTSRRRMISLFHDDSSESDESGNDDHGSANKLYVPRRENLPPRYQSQAEFAAAQTRQRQRQRAQAADQASTRADTSRAPDGDPSRASRAAQPQASTRAAARDPARAAARATQASTRAADQASTRDPARAAQPQAADQADAAIKTVQATQASNFKKRASDITLEKFGYNLPYMPPPPKHSPFPQPPSEPEPPSTDPPRDIFTDYTRGSMPGAF